MFELVVTALSIFKPAGCIDTDNERDQTQVRVKGYSPLHISLRISKM
jgi:hypothetical protein